VRDAATRAGRRVPVADERLFLASTALATVATEDGAVAYSLVEFALQTNGIIEPSPNVLVAWGRLYEPGGDGIPAMMRPALDRIFRGSEISRVGLGAVVRGRRGYGAIVLALLPSRVRTSPIPRAVAADAAVDFEIGLEPGLQDPHVLVTLPSGTVELFEAQAKGTDTFSARLECRGATGKMQVELAARSEEGDESLAKFPVWCGVEPPRTFPIARPANDAPADPAEAERAIFELVNRERTKLGRPALRWDETLAKVARDHSAEMRRVNVVTDRIPHGLSIRQRVRATRSELETTASVGRAYSVAEAHQGLMDLPSTRRKLIADGATDIGIGIVYGEVVGGMRELYITQIVARPASDPPVP
jgi:uncharacterized protein YkwD